MVRKVKVAFVCLVLCCCFATTAQAQSYTVYDGNMSTTYITYFRDIVNNLSLKDDYVCFRSGQNEYILAVGDLEYQDGFIGSANEVEIYRIATEGNYNSTYTYSVTTADSLAVYTGDEILYSNLGNYPNLIERGSQYEILTAVLLSVALLSYVIKRIFC